MPIQPTQVIEALEHTLLDTSAKEADILKLCEEAIEFGMATVCVRPEHIHTARTAIGARHNPLLAVVVGFPEEKITFAQQAEYPMIGACNSTTKLQEITTAQMYGGDELDVVMNVRFLQTDCEVNGEFTQSELQALRMAAGDTPIKLILEVDLLSDAELRRAIACAVEAGIDTIKTSTGFVKDAKGATSERITQMRQILEELGAVDRVTIKASGGVRTLEHAIAVMEAGASRIGTSNAVAIAKEALGQSTPVAGGDY